ncbi:MAG: hypothetical protein FWG03_09535 [Clostridiales bacterium]|nr:hypothetical protein [Clostridiales bacterium]
MNDSTTRKLALSGWLHKTSVTDYGNPLKHQKFLFFYESLSKVLHDEYDLTGLRGYKHGPVFSSVWDERNDQAGSFLDKASHAYQKHPELVNAGRAAVGLFVVQAFTTEELIRITHSMNIWKAKRDEIKKSLVPGRRQERGVPLTEEDFNRHDSSMMLRIAAAFTFEFVNSVRVINVGSANFAFPVKDAERLTPEQYDVLFQLDSDGDLENPVYAYIDVDGAIVVD